MKRARLLILFFTLFTSLFSWAGNIDDRNPISFTEFFGRTPKGLYKISSKTSTSYISSKTNILIHFNLSDYTSSTLELEVYAELLFPNKRVKPISVSGYSKVTEIENKVKTGQQDTTILINYNVRTNTRKNDDISNGITDTEIFLTKEYLEYGAKLFVKVRNIETSIEYCKTFEIQDFGWDSKITAGAVLVKTLSSNKVNFQTAPSASYVIYYKSKPDASFFKQLLTPSFGLSTIALDINQNKTIGLSCLISIFDNSIQCGYGYLLNSPNGDISNNSFIFIGINFIEGLSLFK